MKRSTGRTAAMLALGFVASAALAAPPNVPSSLPYQGLLLDGLGASRTGSVDLTVRIHDAVVGGTLVYKQSFPAVALADGVFTVQLGPTGEGTDSPSNPLTTSLSTALAGDAGITAPVRFLEVTVGGDGALSRTQILASAYAVRASSAVSADTATTATTATNATNVSGVSGLYMSEFFEQFNADGGGPANFDASEGVVDVDGDGILNFIDPDNDADALADASEPPGGINLVNPNATAVTPTAHMATVPILVRVTGTFFEPPLTVAFGSETPAATNVSATSFDVTVGPQLGTKTVTVTNSNGQSDTTSPTFDFATSLLATPAILHQSLAVSPGLARIATSGVAPNYRFRGPALDVTAALATNGSNGQIAVAFDAAGQLAGARCTPQGGGVTCNLDLNRDSDADAVLAEEAGTLIESLGGAATALGIELRFDPSGRPVVFYLGRDTTTRATVAHDRNGDGDFLDANERVVAETITSSTPVPTALAIDSAARVAVAYYSAGAAAIDVAIDRNGDGDYADTVGGAPELFAAAAAPAQPGCVGVAFDGSDRLAVIYASGTATILLWDLNADGDFGDAGESQTIVPFSNMACDVAGRAGQPFSLASGATGGLVIRSDKNGDGDFADAGEVAAPIPIGTGGVDLELDGTNQAAAYTANSSVGVIYRVTTD